MKPRLLSILLLATLTASAQKWRNKGQLEPITSHASDTAYTPPVMRQISPEPQPDYTPYYVGAGAVALLAVGFVVGRRTAAAK